MGKLFFGVPWTTIARAQPFRDLFTLFYKEVDEGGKCLFERAFYPFWIPNEMADSKGGEALSNIPPHQAIVFTAALIKKDTLADEICLERRKFHRGQRQ